MTGNKKLQEMGFKEEAIGHNAIAAGFQDNGSNRLLAKRRLLGSNPQQLIRLERIREAFTVATENDALNGIAMLFGHLLTNTAQIFSDVRTYWSPESVKRVTGKELTGGAANGIIHLINSGSTTLDGTGNNAETGNRR